MFSMKGQGEIIVFLLLLIIGIALFTAATFWSRGIFQQNVDVANVQNAENFVKNLNENILNIVKFGGFKEMKYNLGGSIELVDNRTIEVKIPVNVSLPRNWFNISNSEEYYIQEKLDGTNFRIQLNYTPTNYRIELFTEESSLAMPKYIDIEKNQTFIDNGLTVIKIKITFV